MLSFKRKDTVSVVTFSNNGPQGKGNQQSKQNKEELRREENKNKSLFPPKRKVGDLGRNWL